MTQPRLLTIDGVANQAIRSIGYIPAVLSAWIAELNLDLVSHHRRSVIKHHGFVSGGRTQRFIASRLFGYGSTRPTDRVTRIDQARGESFLAARSTSSGPFPLDEASLRLLEEGGTVRSRRPMAIPIGRGRPFRGAFENVPIWRRTRDGLNARDFDVIPDPDNRSRSFIVDARERSIRRAAREDNDGGDLIVGVLVRTRTQPPKLQFFDQYERILPKHLRKYEAMIEKATTKAGRLALQERLASVLEDRSVYRRVFADHLESKPGEYAAARKVARAAQRDARKERLSR